MAGKKLSDVERGEILAHVVLQNTNGTRNAEYRVEIVRLSGGLVVRIKWGAIGAKPQVKDTRVASGVAAMREYGNKIVAKESGGYQLIAGERGVSMRQLESPAEAAEREKQDQESKAQAANAKREAAMGAMDRAALQARTVMERPVDGEVVYDEV